MRVNHLTHCPDDLMVIALLLDPMIAAAVSGFHLPIAGSALCPQGTHSEVGVGPENQKLKKNTFFWIRNPKARQIQLHSLFMQDYCLGRWFIWLSKKDIVGIVFIDNKSLSMTKLRIDFLGQNANVDEKVGEAAYSASCKSRIECRAEK